MTPPAQIRDVRRIAVASIPSGHPYVRGLSFGDDDVTRLPDPVPEGATSPGQWWPPVMLDPRWIRSHLDDLDLVHVHFGVESFPLEHLRAVIAALRETGKPLVYTVHDLVNPQLTDQSAHDEQLGLLVEAADELITLTHGAAEQIRTRWGRTATVIPHPNVFPLDEAAPAVPEVAGPIVFGTHLRDLRPNIDGVGTTQAMLLAVGRLRAAGVESEARIHLNDRVRDTGARDTIRALADGHQHALLLEGPRPDDDELARALAGLDVAVLPYAFGTHSGWVELCHDLGVNVAGPAVGHIAEQHPTEFFPHEAGDGASLARAVQAAGAAGERPGTAGRDALVLRRRAQRADERVRIAAQHREVYLRALGAHA